MVNFWRLIRFIFDFLYRLILKNKAIIQDSDSESGSNVNRRSNIQRILFGTDEDYSELTYEKASSAKDYSNNNLLENSYLRKRSTQLTNRESHLEYKGAKKDVIGQQEVIMKRNYSRRNSKRFVIGDGEDEFETIPQMPDVTITESLEEPPRNVWSKETNDGRLSVRSTLT